MKKLLLTIAEICDTWDGKIPFCCSTFDEEVRVEVVDMSDRKNSEWLFDLSIRSCKNLPSRRRRYLQHRVRSLKKWFRKINRMLEKGKFEKALKIADVGTHISDSEIFHELTFQNYGSGERIEFVEPGSEISFWLSHSKPRYHGSSDYTNKWGEYELIKTKEKEDQYAWSTKYIYKLYHGYIAVTNTWYGTTTVYAAYTKEEIQEAKRSILEKRIKDKLEKIATEIDSLAKKLVSLLRKDEMETFKIPRYLIKVYRYFHGLGSNYDESITYVDPKTGEIVINYYREQTSHSSEWGKSSTDITRTIILGATVQEEGYEYDERGSWVQLGWAGPSVYEVKDQSSKEYDSLVPFQVEIEDSKPIPFVMDFGHGSRDLINEIIKNIERLKLNPPKKIPTWKEIHSFLRSKGISNDQVLEKVRFTPDRKVDGERLEICLQYHYQELSLYEISLILEHLYGTKLETFQKIEEEWEYWKRLVLR